jgi:hypothetical protein
MEFHVPLMKKNRFEHMKAIDKFWIGFVICLIIPLLFGINYFNIAYKGDLPLWSALFSTARSGFPLFGKLVLLSTFPNLGIFYLFYHADYWHACRGTVVATAIFFIISFIYLA